MVGLGVNLSNKLCNHQILQALLAVSKKKTQPTNRWLVFVPKVQQIYRETAKLCPRNMKILSPDKMEDRGVKRYLKASDGKTHILYHVLAPIKYY